MATDPFADDEDVPECVKAPPRTVPWWLIYAIIVLIMVIYHVV